MLGDLLRHNLSQNWLLNFAPCRWKSLKYCLRNTSWVHNLWREVLRPGRQSHSAQYLRGSSVVLYCFLRGRARCGAECPSVGSSWKCMWMQSRLCNDVTSFLRDKVSRELTEILRSVHATTLTREMCAVRGNVSSPPLRYMDTKRRSQWFAPRFLKDGVVAVLWCAGSEASHTQAKSSLILN